jgi:hypothetical protein
MHNTTEPMEALKYLKNKIIAKFKLVRYSIVSLNARFPVLYVIHIIFSIMHTYMYDSEIYELVTSLLAYTIYLRRYMSK